MTKQIIVTDSTSDLSHEYLKQHNIHVVPLSLTIDGKSFVDQIDITSGGFYSTNWGRCRRKTSQPPIGKFIELYEELGKEDVEIFSIHMSSGLSGTYQTALQASDMVDTKVTVIDSKSISFGLGYQIQRLVELINTNLSSNQIVNKLKELQKEH